MPDLELEVAAKGRGFKMICGVDEAGRGPLAGPVCAAAVILPDGVELEGVNDSKKLSEKKREALFDVITSKATAYSIAFASVEEIEEHNILEATYIAMNRAIEGLSVKPDFALIDGNRIPRNISVPCDTFVKGDAKSLSIAAASILAKVTRDRLLLNYHELFPQYNFAKHKGYGTREHIDAIRKYGLCDIHRPSFLKKLI